MPPKKPVKEEKILLGRPGNNLKSGIVCISPERALSDDSLESSISTADVAVIDRLVLPMLENPRYSKPSRNALLEIRP